MPLGIVTGTSTKRSGPLASGEQPILEVKISVKPLDYYASRKQFTLELPFPLDPIGNDLVNLDIRCHINQDVEWQKIAFHHDKYMLRMWGFCFVATMADS